MRSLVALCAALLLGLPAFASPSAFPETAISFQVGYQGLPALAASGELMLPVRFVDVAVGLDATIDTSGVFAARLFATGLLFPSVGTVPPLALGVGTDVSYAGGAVGGHLGIVVGSDLLFVSDLPATLSLYLAPGLTLGQGFSLAWSFEARYYFDRVALVLSSSDQLLVGVGVRVPF
jgi:hypothetical protein